MLCSDTTWAPVRAMKLNSTLQLLALPLDHEICLFSQLSSPSKPVQAKLDELESELLEINGNSERLQRSHSELMELQLVLEKAGGFFDDAQHRASAAQFESGPPSPADSKLLCSDRISPPL